MTKHFYNVHISNPRQPYDGLETIKKNMWGSSPLIFFFYCRPQQTPNPRLAEVEIYFSHFCSCSDACGLVPLLLYMRILGFFCLACYFALILLFYRSLTSIRFVKLVVLLTHMPPMSSPGFCSGVCNYLVFTKGNLCAEGYTLNETVCAAPCCF